MSTSLVECCNADNVPAARAILRPYLEQIERAADADAANRKKDELLTRLFVDDYKEESPVEAAIVVGSGRAAASRHESNNAQIRVFVLECLKACGPISRFERVKKHPAHVPRLGPTLLHQVLRYTARLGGLARPYSKTIKGDKVIDDSLMVFCLEEVCQLSHGELGLCIAKGFHDEAKAMSECLRDYRVLRLLPYRQRNNFPNDIDRGNIGKAFRLPLKMAMDADVVSDRYKGRGRLYEAEQMAVLSRRLQDACATALDVLGDDATYTLMCHARGQQAMRIAALEGMRTFVSHGAVRGALRRVFLGELLYNLLRRPNICGALRYLAIVLYSVALMPFIAATPMIDNARSADHGWVAIFGGREFYLPQVASFQAVSFQLLDLLLACYLTFLPSTYPLCGFLWACSALWFEFVQIRKAFVTERLSQRIGGLGAYFVQDRATHDARIPVHSESSVYH